MVWASFSSTFYLPIIPGMLWFSPLSVCFFPLMSSLSSSSRVCLLSKFLSFLYCISSSSLPLSGLSRSLTHDMQHSSSSFPVFVPIAPLAFPFLVLFVLYLPSFLASPHLPWWFNPLCSTYTFTINRPVHVVFVGSRGNAWFCVISVAWSLNVAVSPYGYSVKTVCSVLSPCA